MKLSIAKQLTAGLLLSMASVFANAGIINVTEGGFDAFKDDVSGLTWIDFDKTTNRFQADIVQLFDEGEEFYGWRLANQSEIEALVANFDALDGIMDGLVAHDDDGSVVFPIVGTGNSRAIINPSKVDNYFELLSKSHTADTIKIDTFGPADKEHSLYSNLLVKVTDVPEPTTLAIFGLGLAGLAFRRKGTKA